MALAALALATFGGCGGDSAVGECPPGSQSQEESGRSLVFITCIGCHSSMLEGDARLGAPVGLDFDQVSIVRAEADAIYGTVLDGSMPPGGAAFNDAQREAIRVYLACEASR